MFLRYLWRNLNFFFCSHNQVLNFARFQLQNHWVRCFNGLFVFIIQRNITIYTQLTDHLFYTDVTFIHTQKKTRWTSVPLMCNVFSKFDKRFKLFTSSIGTQIFLWRNCRYDKIRQPTIYKNQVAYYPTIQQKF